MATPSQACTQHSLFPSAVLSHEAETIAHVPGSTGVLARLGIQVHPTLLSLLHDNSPVCVGVSGGKDGSTAAAAVFEYLDSINHTGPRLLVHSHLGDIEHRDSLPQIQKLATALNTELAVIYPARDMISRWQYRWQCNVARYENLQCVKLIMPWSGASMRFCTSELKIWPIGRYLSQRFRGQTIISVTGVRSEESPDRAKASTFRPADEIARAPVKNSFGATRGYTWLPIKHYRTEDVFLFLRERSLPVHEAYDRYGLSRVSCAFCVLASQRDLLASSAITYNQDVYRRLVQLEAQSTFSFQRGRWLADIAPDLLDADLRAATISAKQKAVFREESEARIPRHLLYVKGWPTYCPNLEEARLLCEIRSGVANAVGLSIKYSTPDELIERYRELMLIQELKPKRKLRRAA